MPNRRIITPMARVRPFVPLRTAPSLTFAARYAQQANTEPRPAPLNVGVGEAETDPSNESRKNFRYITSRTPKISPFLELPRIQDNKLMVHSPKENKLVQIPNIWLRDNCQCKTCVHEDTKQRLLDTWQIPKDISIASCEFSEEKSRIKITWSDGHETVYRTQFLARTSRTYRGNIRQGLTEINPWGAGIKDNEPTVPFRKVFHSEKGVLDLLWHIRTNGFCYIHGTPTREADTTKHLLERIAFIRLTHYGGFYDFTADLASKDTAYTALALDAHTDNTYFSDPAGLQALHLLSHKDGEGGASLLVDGFKIAEDLRREDPKAYEVLSTVNVHSHASGNEGISIQPYRGFPVLNHDPSSGLLLQVRWNSNDRAAIDLPIEKMEEWYAAAAKWVEISRRPENEYWNQLTPGRVLVFDNWRVMHGRSAFTGKRRICGAYINRDDWISRFKMLQLGKDKVLEAIPLGM